MKSIKNNELSNRQKQILFAMVKEYCDNGSSTGSKELQQKYGFDFSPATIRNEMSAIRDKGYLYQPFTNSSSQPTEDAFKLFINQLIEGLQITSQQQHKMKEKVLELQAQHAKMNQEIAKLLAEQSGGAAFSLSSNGDRSITGMANLLRAGGSGKMEDVLDFLDHLDDYKQHLLPGEVEDLLDKDKVTKQNKHAIKTVIGDENPIIPLGKGYAMVTTEVVLENGEKSVVGLITPVALLTKKRNLQLMEALNQVLGGNPETNINKK